MVKCPAGKIINPKSGRCVDRDGKKGKEILRSRRKKSSTKKCPVGKIMNPKSGRCVDRDGKKGKEILKSLKKKSSPKKSSPKKSSPKKSSPKKSSPKKSSSSGCVIQTSAKYNSLTRKSPPYPANKCRGKILLGNDGNMYRSVSNINGVYTWRIKK
jgi:hypothetical protein